MYSLAHALAAHSPRTRRVCIIRDTRNQIETDVDWAITQIPPIFRINQGPLCFALFAFVKISKVNLKRFQSKHTGDRSVGGYRFSKTIPKLRGMGYNSDSTNHKVIRAFQDHPKSYVEWAITQIPPVSRTTWDPQCSIHRTCVRSRESIGHGADLTENDECDFEFSRF